MAVPGEGLAVDEVNPTLPPGSGARQGRQRGAMALGEGVWLIRQQDDFGIGLGDGVQLDHRVSFRGVGADIGRAGLPEALMSLVTGFASGSRGGR